MNGTSLLSYLILTLAIGYVFVYPSFGEIGLLLDQKQKNEHSLSLIADIENKKNQLLTKFNQIPAADKKSIDTVLPDSLDFVKLISQIDAVAGGQKISIDRITSKELDSSVGNAVAEAGPSKPYRSALISFSFTTTHEKFTVFMDSLEKSLRILDLKALKIYALESGLYMYTVDFETYWLKSL